jgi:L-2-hydroxyglutarate oxidase LhgO
MHPLERLEFSRQVAKRAQYEAFEFSLTNQGVVVRNESYANPEKHEYAVRVDECVPVDYECPANQAYDRACKHGVAVAIRTPVLDAAQEQDGTALPAVVSLAQLMVLRRKIKRD